MIPELLFLATEENTIAATIDSAVGFQPEFTSNSNEVKYLATFLLHSAKNGILKNIKYKHGIKDKVIKEVLYKNVGDYL